jgi:2-haloacid dehalogenase
MSTRSGHHALVPIPVVHIDAVVFDLGGVLIDWDPRHVYRSVFDNDDDMEEFLGSVCTMGWHYQHDLGRPMAETLPELIVRFPHREAEIMAWVNQDEMVGGAIEPVVSILRKLREQSVRCFALTNWPEDSFARLRDRFAFLAWFDGIVVSGAEGVAKPDPEIFRRLLDRYGLDAQSTLFVDDTPMHLHVARDLGMRVHHYTTGEALVRELATVGLA